VLCPWHNAAFSVKTGYPEQGPVLNGISTFEVKEENGELTIHVPKDKLNTKQSINMCTKGSDSSNYVIIGGGPAGLSAAEALRQAGYEGSITILS
jgi:hypothetical protein